MGLVGSMGFDGFWDFEGEFHRDPPGGEFHRDPPSVPNKMRKIIVEKRPQTGTASKQGP